MEPPTMTTGRPGDHETTAEQTRPTATVGRRAVLATAGVAGFAGCLGVLSGGGPNTQQCEDTGLALEAPDGSTHCVSPVESDRTVEEYYGYDGDSSDSANTPDDLSVEDATVTFVYRNAATGARSLVVVNGDATTSTDGGGGVALTFEGVAGYEWQVRDGPPGQGFGDFDPYGTEEGAFGSSESVLWGWGDDKTDGGAFGPLGESFDVDVVHRAEGTVGDQSKERSGVDRWLFLDGDDVETPVELATFDDDTGDVSARLFTPDGE